MRKYLLIVLPLLLIVGCSKEPRIDEETLIEKNGLMYHPETKKLYSGIAFDSWEETIPPYEGGTGKSEAVYKDGIRWSMTVWRFYPTGEMHEEIHYKEGRREILTSWYRNGQKGWENTYKDGNIAFFTEWYENGQKKTEGNLTNPSEKWKKWNEDGSLKE